MVFFLSCKNWSILADEPTYKPLMLLELINPILEKKGDVKNNSKPYVRLDMCFNYS